MTFNKKAPEWRAKGVEPPASKRESGWLPSEKPSADYWNWQMNSTYEALEELQEKAAEKTDVSGALKDAKAYTDQKVADIDLSKITPESIGAAKQSDLTAHVQDNTKHITAAERNTWNGKETPDGAQQKANAAETNAKNASLPRAGGTINGDLAVTNTLYVASRNVIWEIDQAKQSGVNAKQGAVDVLNSKSVAASINDPWPTLNSKIGTLHGRRDDRFAVEGSSGMNGTSTWLYTSLGTIPAGATQVLFNTRPTDDWNGTYVIFPQNGGWSSQAKLQLIDKNGKIATIAELSGSNYAITRVVIQSLIYGPTDGSLYSNIGYFSNGSKSGFGTGLRNVGTLDNSGVIQIRLDVFNPDRLVEYKLDMDQISYL